jgi:hypothetical protein
MGAGAIWGLLRLKPWKARKVSVEPVSPRTRRTNKLLGLAVLVTVPGTLALAFGTMNIDHPLALFSNSPVPLWIAIFAIASWLLGQAINKWWWYFSADEHERKADDFGNLVAWALFVTVTPAWWVAARAGLLPPPNAMLLWLVAVWVAAIGWYWRRHR